MLNSQTKKHLIKIQWIGFSEIINSKTRNTQQDSLQSSIHYHQMSDSTATQTSAIISQSLLPVKTEYPTALYIVCPILITYFGIFLMLRNHYIFKPKIQNFLRKTRIKSIIFKQTIIDVLSSLSILTLLLSSLLLSYSDQAIELVIHHDLYWIGLYMGVLAYRNIRQEQILEMKVIIKNGIMLLLAYTLLLQEYFVGYSFLLMGLLLMAVYIANIFFKVYEQDFVNLIEVLFNSKHLEISNAPYSHINNRESPEFLSTHFPVSREELQQKLHSYEPQLRRLKLKTKISVTKKMLMLSLAIRLSQEKMLAKMKRDVGAYYGGLNGTTNQKIKRLDFQLQQKNTLLQETNQKEAANQAIEQEVVMNGLDVDDELQVLFTIFPVKLFESSTMISNVFTVLLNLAFGVCLDYILSMTSTLKYGAFLNNLYALIILPVLPNISKRDFFNSMALSSIWKYFLVGLFVTLSVLVNGNGAIITSSVLQIEVVFVMVMVMFVMGHLLVESKSEYKLFILFSLLFAANLGVNYKGSLMSSS